MTFLAGARAMTRKNDCPRNIIYCARDNLSTYKIPGSDMIDFFVCLFFVIFSALFSRWLLLFLKIVYTYCSFKKKLFIYAQLRLYCIDLRMREITTMEQSIIYVYKRWCVTMERESKVYIYTLTQRAAREAKGNKRRALRRWPVGASLRNWSWNWRARSCLGSAMWYLYPTPILFMADEFCKFWKKQIHFEFFK